MSLSEIQYYSKACGAACLSTAQALSTVLRPKVRPQAQVSRRRAYRSWTNQNGELRT